MPVPGVGGAVAGILGGKTCVLTGIFPEVMGVTQDGNGGGMGVGATHKRDTPRFTLPQGEQRDADGMRGGQYQPWHCMSCRWRYIHLCNGHGLSAMSAACVSSGS